MTSQWKGNSIFTEMSVGERLHMCHLNETQCLFRVELSSVAVAAAQASRAAISADADFQSWTFEPRLMLQVGRVQAQSICIECHWARGQNFIT